MIWFFCLAMMQDNHPDWLIETNIFHPLSIAETLLRPDGGIYILQFREAHVDYFDPHGKPVAKIGGKGEGPGAFVYPVAFYHEDGRLYVYDRNNNSVSIFDEDHRFVVRKAFPERNLMIEKVRGGWVYGNWDGRGHQGPRQLYYVDHRLEKPRLLMEISRYGRGGGLYQSSSHEGATSEFGGISRRANIVASHDRQRIYLTDPLDFEIQVIDPYLGKVLGTIRKEIERLPFDEEWADEKLARLLEGHGLPMTKVKRNYPDFFPVIRSLTVDPDGNLMVNMWRGRPDQYSNTMILDERGNEVKGRFGRASLSRLVGILEGYAYITVYDDHHEQAGIARVPMDDAAAFVKANPIRYGDAVTRTISSSSVQ